MKVRGQYHAPVALDPAKEPGTHWIKGWVGPHSRPGRFWRKQNLLPMAGFEPRVTHAVASSYTIYDIPDPLRPHFNSINSCSASYFSPICNVHDIYQILIMKTL